VKFGGANDGQEANREGGTEASAEDMGKAEEAVVKGKEALGQAS